MNPYAATSMYYCQFHDFKTQLWNYWIIHLKMHDLSNKETKCPICFADFEDNQQMITHLMNKRHHELFVCKFCDKGLSSKHSMIRHQANACEGEIASIPETQTLLPVPTQKRFKCEDCNKELANKHSLIRHKAETCIGKMADLRKSMKIRISPISRRVGITEKFKCQYCNAELSSLHSLQRHQENVNACARNNLKLFLLPPPKPVLPEKKVRCDQCGVQLSSRRSLRRHKKSLNACEMRVIIEMIPTDMDNLFTAEQTKILDSIQFETIEMLKAPFNQARL